jgi:hypothetical protein
MPSCCNCSVVISSRIRFTGRVLFRTPVSGCFFFFFGDGGFENFGIITVIVEPPATGLFFLTGSETEIDSGMYPQPGHFHSPYGVLTIFSIWHLGHFAVIWFHLV